MDLKKLKVLPLSNWMIPGKQRESYQLDCLNHYEPMEPLINRNGRYAYRTLRGTWFTWFEIDGKAWLDEEETFKYDFEKVEDNRLTINQITSLKFLINTLKPGELKNQCVKTLINHNRSCLYHKLNKAHLQHRRLLKYINGESKNNISNY